MISFNIQKFLISPTLLFKYDHQKVIYNSGLVPKRLMQISSRIDISVAAVINSQMLDSRKSKTNL